MSGTKLAVLKDSKFERISVTCVRATTMLRLLHRMLPLERRFFALLRGYGAVRGLLSVPWGKFRLHFPSRWLPDVCGAVYKSPKANNPEFFEILAPLISKLNAGSIVDIGAAMGVYILNFRAFTDARIVAYEPNPLVFGLAKYNIWSNGIGKVDLRNTACGEAKGSINLRAGINSCIDYINQISAAEVASGDCDVESLFQQYGSGNQSFSVPLVTLDNDLESETSISLLKIDCEGFEYHILKGARKVIKKHRPVIFIELHPQYIGNYGHSIEEVGALLRPMYELAFWDYTRSERSPDPAVRFFGRYSCSGHRFPNEAAMLNLATSAFKPSQLFLLAQPRR